MNNKYEIKIDIEKRLQNLINFHQEGLKLVKAGIVASSLNHYKAWIFDDVNKLIESWEKYNKEEPDKDILLTHIDDLEASVRLKTICEHNKINYLGELCQKTEKELFKMRCLGLKTINEIKEILSNYGLSLRTEEE